MVIVIFIGIYIWWGLHYRRRVHGVLLPLLAVQVTSSRNVTPVMTVVWVVTACVVRCLGFR